MIRVESDFPFIGERDYVHGSTILSGFIDLLERESGGGPIVVKRVKFQRPVGSNGEMTFERGMAKAASDSASVIFAATVGGEPWHGAFVPRGLPVTRRLQVSYPVSELRASGFAGSCRISPRDRDDLIRSFVEANKRFQEGSVERPPSAVRFGYLENWAVPARDMQLEGRLEAKNLIARRTTEGVMTVNQLSYTPANGVPVTMTLCFNVALDPQTEKTS